MRRTKGLMAAAAMRLCEAWRCGVAAIAMLAVTPFAAGAERPPRFCRTPNSRRSAGRSPNIERVSREISLSEERKASLAAEIAEVKKDAASITAALIQSAKTERKLGQDIEDITDRVEALKAQEDGHQAVARRPPRACWPKCSARCSAWGSIRRRPFW